MERTINVPKKLAIEIGIADRQFLRKKFGVTRQTIWNALEGHTGSKKSERIRQEALKLGGFYVEY